LILIASERAAIRTGVIQFFALRRGRALQPLFMLARPLGLEPRDPLLRRQRDESAR
jgi:hypothetical protein